MTLETIKKSIRNIPNYPKEGIQFKDITTAIKQPEIFKEVIDMFVQHYKNEHIDYVIDSLKKNTTKVKNIRSYLLTALYNSYETLDHYYRSEVNYDLYG